MLCARAACSFAWLLTSSVVFLSAASLPAAEPEVLDIGSRRELFVEDTLVDSLGGAAQLRLHHPTPQNVAIVHDKPWEGTGSGYHTVFRDGDLYRMYYRGWHLDFKDGKLSTAAHDPFYCYAESTDGITWKKPDLGLFEFQGNKANNIVLQGLGTHNFAVFRDDNPDCDPAAKYKGLGGIAREGGLFAFQSPDGVHWKLLQQDPVITDGAFDSQNLAFWDPVRKEYRAYWRVFTAGETTQKNWKPGGYRAIRTATSRDFIKWENQADVTYVDSPPEHLYTNQVAPYIRAPHLLIGFPTRYVDRGWNDSAQALPDREQREFRSAANRRYGTAVTEGLLMASRDGVRFKRWNEAFLRPGPQRPGTWQYGQQYIAWHAVETSSALPGAPPELSLYATESYWHGPGTALRRYTLRLDGFVSVHAPVKGGTLTTKPFTFAGDRLEINFSSSAAGGVWVELQDAQGEPIPGFTIDDSNVVYGDQLDRVVSWENGNDVSQLAGKPVRLKFQLEDADLYSFRFRSAD